MSEPVGNDGLTDAERSDLAQTYIDRLDKAFSGMAERERLRREARKDQPTEPPDDQAARS